MRSTVRDRPFDVVTIGDCCVDLIVSGEDVTPQFGQVEKRVGDYTLELGGSACLFAAQAAKLGLGVAVFGAVGADLYGRFVRERLASAGVDVRYVRTVPGLKTGLGVALDRRGDRAILTYPGSIDAVAEPDVPDAFLASARHLHLGSFYLMRHLRPGVPRLVERARRLGLSVSLDPNWNPDGCWDGGLLDLLPQIDLFLPNEQELLAIVGGAGAAQRAPATRNLPAEQAARVAVEWLGHLARCVAIKRGAAGAWLWRGRIGGGETGASNEPDACRLECVPPPVPGPAVADSVGAGDAFDAGLVSGLLRGWSDAEALLAAWSRHDPDAAWSYPSKHHGRVFGYKVHVLLDRVARLPLFFLVSPANRNDLPVAYPLLWAAHFVVGLPLRVVRADGAGWGGHLVEWIVTVLRARPIIPFNRKRQPLERVRHLVWAWLRSTARAIVERFFGSPNAPMGWTRSTPVAGTWSSARSRSRCAPSSSSP